MPCRGYSLVTPGKEERRNPGYEEQPWKTVRAQRPTKARTLVSDGMMQTFKNAFYNLLFLRRKESLFFNLQYIAPLVYRSAYPVLQIFHPSRVVFTEDIVLFQR